MSWLTENNFIVPSGAKGEVQTTCPKCSHSRKKKSDKCLSINIDKKTWFCHHCQYKGRHFEPEHTDVVYVKPEWSNNTKLSDNVVKWFETRGIRQKTLTDARITEGLEFMPQLGKNVQTVQFNYFLNNELINVKYRTRNKDFKLHKGSELIPYNIDSIINSDEVIITEGEIDALSFIEAGYLHTISVPNGANAKNNNLSYLDRYIDLFEGKEIILAVDNDTNGRKLRDELAFRLGIENCKWLDFKEFKDANEVLVSGGITAIQKLMSEVKEFPLQGVYEVKDFNDDVYDIFKNGLKKGAVLGMGTIDKNISFERGYITTVTGIPGHGKSDFVDQATLKLAINEGWKTSFFSPENKPTKLHISKLIRKLVNKTSNEVTQNEIKMCLSWLNEYFSFMQPEDNYTIDTILSMVKSIKRRKGLDNFVIDAWNKLEHRYKENESRYIGETLDKIGDFCYRNNVHCFLVAHPTKMPKQKDTSKIERPNLYSISGSSNFYNKTDNGLVVYRNFGEDAKVEVDILKVKFNHWGEVGRVYFNYNTRSGRYYEVNDEESWINYKQEEIVLPERGFKGIQPNNEFEIGLDELAPDWMKDELKY